MNTENKTLLSKEEKELKNLPEPETTKTRDLKKKTKKSKNSVTIKSIASLIEEIKIELKETKEEIESLRKDFRVLGPKEPPPEVNLITSSDNQDTTEIRKKEIIDTREEDPQIEDKFKVYPTVPVDSVGNIKLCGQVKQKDRRFLSFLKRTKKTIKKYAKKLTVLILLPVRSVYKSFSKISIGR